MRAPILIAFIAILFNAVALAQNTALLIVDIQNFYFPGGATPLVEPQAAADNAAKVADFFRSNNMPVIHVKHVFEPGGEIHATVQPHEGEAVFEKKSVNSFVGTGLKEYLDSRGIKNIVVCGMQTHMCVEAAVRAASDFGYSVTLIHDACATRDLKWFDTVIMAKYVHESTLATLRSYCKVMSAEEFLAK